jgi:hypothetical protein
LLLWLDQSTHRAAARSQCCPPLCAAAGNMSTGSGTGSVASSGNARVKALSSQLSRALDELKVFIPPPIQSIISKLAVASRGTALRLPLLPLSLPRS